MSTSTSHDAHSQLRALYMALLTSQERFDEFRRLLALYELDANEHEPEEAAEVRQALNVRIRQWVGAHFEGLTPAQALLWRAIIVDQRFNVSLSPWKESNAW